MGVLVKWKRSFYKKFLKMGVISPKIMILLDGGICSQMHQYLLGQLYRNRGYKIAYDLSFYDEWGMDKDHKFVRNFDLLKAFPYLELESASKTSIIIYKRKFYNIGNNTTERVDDFSFLEKRPPVYLGGYYHLPADLWLNAFRSLFRIDLNVLDEINKQICDEIDSCPGSVAVHVRRGDLKVELYDYGKPASVDYFKRSVGYCKEQMAAVPYFYFFSDEPDWVINELVPSLQLTIDNCKVVNINGSDKGYMDLILIARCKHQITSKGTMGKYGALLMDNPQKITILCDDEIEYSWRELLQNPVFL